MECEEARPLIDASLDGQLDLPHGLAVEEHLRRCPGCTADYRQRRALIALVRGNAERYTAPEGLRARLRAALPAPEPAAPPPQRRRRSVWTWLPAGLSAASVAALALSLSLYWAVPTAQDRLTQEVVTAHIRSLMANHLTDVASADQHTVKPWFNGRLDVSPPVRDLSEQGFPLVGGRLDYLDERPVAALIYRHRQHVINLFVWPEPSAGAVAAGQASSPQGYNILHWSRSGMSFWAISDLNLPDLERFRQLLLAEDSPAAAPP